jgi:hypothetical protein
MNSSMDTREWKRLAAKAGLALLFAPRYYVFLTEVKGGRSDGAPGAARAASIRVSN